MLIATILLFPMSPWFSGKELKGRDVRVPLFPEFLRFLSVCHVFIFLEPQIFVFLILLIAFFQRCPLRICLGLNGSAHVYLQASFLWQYICLNTLLHRMRYFRTMCCCGLPVRFYSYVWLCAERAVPRVLEGGPWAIEHYFIDICPKTTFRNEYLSTRSSYYACACWYCVVIQCSQLLAT